MCYIQGAHSILSSFKGGNAMRKKKKSSFESSIHVYRAMARMTQQDLANRVGVSTNNYSTGTKQVQSFITSCA